MSTLLNQLIIGCVSTVPPRILISCPFIDIHDCQMAQHLIAHIETLMCQDVSQQIESPLQMTCGARPTDKKTRAMEDRIGNSAQSPSTKQLLRKVFLAGEMVLAKQYVAPTQCEESQGSPCSLHCGTAWEVFATHQLETINGFLCFCLVLDCFFLYKLSFLLHIICDASCSCAAIVRAY